jgi:PrtD family type I secretion system ABC transporter
MKNKTNLMRDRIFTPAVKHALRYILALSVAINILLLTSPLYMLQLYDRVLSSRSEETLLSLSVIVLFLMLGFGILEVMRSRIMIGISVEIDQHLNQEVFTSLFQEAISRGEGISGQPLRDLEAIRTMFSGHAMIALFDLPWAPFFIVLIFIMHPLLGVVALAGVLATIVLAIASERSSRPLMADASSQQIIAHRFVEACLKNVDVIHALGMLKNIRERWLVSYTKSVGAGAETSGMVSTFSGSTKALRLILQSAILGCGAWLALKNEVSPGVMVAASIIFGKALGPLEQSIAASRGFLAARTSFKRLELLLSRHVDAIEPMALPKPEGKIAISEVALVIPGSNKPLLQGVSFSLEAGEILAIVGPSASGKSSLARALIGLWRPVRGTIRLDGAALDQWEPGLLGQYIGYLPQDVELLAGTVKENIARFGVVDPQAVVEAASKAGCHQMVLNLPDGYDTFIGDGGNRLSGGQSQRIALARCFYNNPVFAVLDEPDSNLDIEGVAALDQAIAKMKSDKTTVVLITHNIRLLRHADKAMLLVNGGIGYFGTPRELVEKLSRRVTP